MKIRWHRFNLYLLLAVTAITTLGCRSPEKKLQKAETTFRLHQEVAPDTTGRSNRVPVYRENPMMVNVERSPFLNESLVKEAKVVDTVGGFSLSVQFDRRGTWLLEQYTSGNRGKRIGIFCEFANPGRLEPQPPGATNKPPETLARWIAAPKIPKPIKDGLLVFTPDASRKEADQIATGLNNVSKRLGTAKESNF